jgi:hypothetical protein
MRLISESRLLAVAAALLAAPLATVAFGGTASAASFPGAAVTCTRIVGQTQLKTATLTGCTAASTGGRGAVANYALNGGDVTWTNGTTTNYTATATRQGTDCPSVSEEFKIAGSVTSSTNPSIAVGSAVKMKVCFDPGNDEARTSKGTTIKF